MIVDTECHARRVEQYASDQLALRGGRFETRQAFVDAFAAMLRAMGYAYYPAVTDAAGQCDRCGEAGHCPGWHVLSREVASGNYLTRG